MIESEDSGITIFSKVFPVDLGGQREQSSKFSKSQFSPEDVGVIDRVGGIQ